MSRFLFYQGKNADNTRVLSRLLTQGKRKSAIINRSSDLTNYPIPTAYCVYVERCRLDIAKKHLSF